LCFGFGIVGVIVHDMREWCWVSFAGGVYCYMVC
jgi:hypothetical protein